MSAVATMAMHPLQLAIQVLCSAPGCINEADALWYCPQGALLCLAASAVALNEPSEAHLRQVVPPVLASFTDPDARVRYYACEQLLCCAVLWAVACLVAPMYCWQLCPVNIQQLLIGTCICIAQVKLSTTLPRCRPAIGLLRLQSARPA